LEDKKHSSKRQSKPTKIAAAPAGEVQQHKPLSADRNCLQLPLGEKATE